MLDGFFNFITRKLTGDDVISLENDPIEIHKDDPKIIIVDSPCNDPDSSKSQSTCRNSVFDKNFSNLKVSSNGDWKFPLSSTIENVDLANVSIQSTVLESEVVVM